MSENIKHECGIALLRLRKPLDYYIENKGIDYAAKLMFLLMQKQHNRGQEGVGVANIKLDVKPGYRYISRYRKVKGNPLEWVYEKIYEKYKSQLENASQENVKNAEWLKENVAFTGELWLGHLRYATHGKNSLEYCHPFLRQNNWKSRSLVMAGNFNLTNVDELFNILVSLGQHPKERIDTLTVMEKFGHFLDEENKKIYKKYKKKLPKEAIPQKIEEELDIQKVIKKSCKDFDGGYVMAGLIGNGSAFVARDPVGIRPAYYYVNEDLIVVASEKHAILTAIDDDYEKIKELQPAHALIIYKNGEFEEKPFAQAKEKKSCSFERIYFSRGSDKDIYQERKKLGMQLVPSVLKAIKSDLRNTLFSYIPNTAETAFHGLLNGIDDFLIAKRKGIILEDKPDNFSKEEILEFKPRIEKLVIKDAKLRTFITNDDDRNELVSHVYDTTYGTVKETDNLVIIDDSIVRGTTLQKSILTLLSRLNPKKIVIVSSAPQVRYPDCYGIDLSNISDLVAFRALMALIAENNKTHLLKETQEKCKQAGHSLDQPNFVQNLYDEFTYSEISNKIAEIVRPKNMKTELEVVFQTIEGLHHAIPNHTGDWYFTGNYPTPGGNRIVNRAFLNHREGYCGRSY